MEIPLECPNCKTHIKRSLRSLKNGAEFECECGAVLQIKGDVFTDAQRGIDDLAKTLGKTIKESGKNLIIKQ